MFLEVVQFMFLETESTNSYVPVFCMFNLNETSLLY